MFRRFKGELTCPERRRSSDCPSCNELEASGQEEEEKSSGGQTITGSIIYQEASLSRTYLIHRWWHHTSESMTSSNRSKLITFQIITTSLIFTFIIFTLFQQKSLSYRQKRHQFVRSKKYSAVIPQCRKTVRSKIQSIWIKIYLKYSWCRRIRMISLACNYSSLMFIW